MPRWTFESTPNTLSVAEKESLARQITAIYVEIGLPAFLINVIFHENPSGCFFTGGQIASKHIFFHIDHAASPFPSEEFRLSFISRVNKIVKPVFDPKGIEYEYNVYEHPRDNWRVNGVIPPVDYPEIWQQWVEKDRAVIYDENQVLDKNTKLSWEPAFKA